MRWSLQGEQSVGPSSWKCRAQALVGAAAAADGEHRAGQTLGVAAGVGAERAEGAQPEVGDRVLGVDVADDQGQPANILPALVEHALRSHHEAAMAGGHADAVAVAGGEEALPRQQAAAAVEVDGEVGPVVEVEAAGAVVGVPEAGVHLPRVDLVETSRGTVAALGFAASAWKWAARDAHIGWDARAREARLHLAVGSARFLILPHVRVANLASVVLSRTARRLRSDRQTAYGYEPVSLETFVERGCFSGASYRAADRLCVGRTKGRGKPDRRHQPALPVKDVHLYPPHRGYRRILTAPAGGAARPIRWQRRQVAHGLAECLREAHPRPIPCTGASWSGGARRRWPPRRPGPRPETLRVGIGS